MFRILVLLFIIFLNYSKCEKYIKFYKTDCNFNPKYVANGTCTLKMKSRQAFIANVEYDLLIEMKNVIANPVMYKFYNQFRPFLIDQTVKLCEITDKNSFLAGMNYYTKTIYRIVNRNTNALICHHKVSLYFQKFIFLTFIFIGWPLLLSKYWI